MLHISDLKYHALFKYLSDNTIQIKCYTKYI